MALHALLEEDTDALVTMDPQVVTDLGDDLYLYRVCKEFPGTSWVEALRWPMRRTMALLDLGDYIRAKADIERADEEHPPERTAWFHLVMDVIEARAEEERAWRAARLATDSES